MRSKFIIILIFLAVLVSLMVCSSKKLIDKEDVDIKNTEPFSIMETEETYQEEKVDLEIEQTELNFSSENKSDSFFNNTVSKPSSNIEPADTENNNSEVINKKPIANTPTYKPTINNSLNTSSETQEEQSSNVTEEETPSTPEISMDAFGLINAERLKLGLEPAIWDTECERIALIRGEEIAPYAIPEHDGFLKFQNENRKLCECLAWGYLTAEGAVDGWMNSSAHKDILLDPDYVKIAVVQIGSKWVAVNSR